REPAAAEEVTVAGDGFPRRDRTGAYNLRDLVAPPVDVLVDGELEGRRAPAAVTFLAMLLEDGHDVARERRLGTGGAGGAGGGTDRRDRRRKGETDLVSQSRRCPG